MSACIITLTHDADFSFNVLTLHHLPFVPTPSNHPLPLLNQGGVAQREVTRDGGLKSETPPLLGGVRVVSTPNKSHLTDEL